jgi:diguanylate cyclase (GGDEF)-like protein/PAS domain S-box-containing protein
VRELHSLLKRQLAKHLEGGLGECASDLGSVTNPFVEQSRALLEAVNEAYYGWDSDLRMLERSLDLSSNELLEANSELRAIFQAFPDLLFRLDAEGRILDCKGAGATDSYLPVEELIGRCVQKIPIHDVADKFQRALDEVQRTGSTVVIEYSLQRQDDEQHYEARLVPLPDGNTIAIVRNITERKTAESALQFARFALDRSADPVFWVYPDAQLFYANDAACRALRCDRPDLLASSMAAFDVNFSPRTWDRRWRELKSKEHLMLESVHRASDGRLFPVEVLMNYVEFGGQEYACVFARDITERRRADAELRDSGDRLKKQQAALVGLTRNQVLFRGDLVLAVREITEAAARTLDVARASVWLYDDDRTGILCFDLYERDANQHTEGVVIQAATAPSYFRALESDRIIAAHDALNDPRTRRLSDSHMIPIGIASKLDVPIVLGGHTVGVACHEHIGPPRQWSADEQGFAGSIADLISLAIEAAERRKAEAALRIRTSAMNAATDQIVIIDVDGKIEFVNPSFERETGYTQCEVQGRSADFLGLSAKDEARSELWDTVTAGNTWHGEINLQRKDGDFVVEDVTVTPIRNDAGEVERFIAIKRNVTEKKAYERELDYLAHHDHITGLPNRLRFSDRLTECLARARRRDHMVAVLFLDLDRFKLINDSLGHSAGDLLIEAVSRRLTESLGEAAVIARMGGDEFTVILSPVSSASEVAAAARRAVCALSAPFVLTGQEVFATVSIGVSMFPSDGDDVETLVRNADSAMYRAKELGRNNFQFYTKAMNAEAVERMQLEGALRRAVERNEFALRYQPKVDVRTGRIVGAEALVRWEHPDIGIVSPAQFIPLAEETGLIVPIGEWVMRTACARSREWQAKGYMPVTVGVNVSARQFRQDALIDEVRSILRETGLAPEYLDIELTESVLMHSLDLAVGILTGLKEMGVKLSLDDFGTGYSSLMYLKRLPIDTVKIDRSFIRDMATNEDDAEITRAVIAMAQTLKLKVVAEGVETLEQLRLLHRLGCDEMQGYFIGKPVRAAEFEELLRRGGYVETEYWGARAA